MMRPSAPGRRQLIVAFSDGRDSTSIIDEKTAEEIARLTDAVVDIVVPVAGRASDAGSRRLAQRNGSIDSLAGGRQRGRRRTVAPQSRDADQASRRVLADLVGPTSGQVFPLGDRRFGQPRLQGDAGRLPRELRAAVRAAGRRRARAGTRSSVSGEEAPDNTTFGRARATRVGVRSRYRRLLLMMRIARARAVLAVAVLAFLAAGVRAGAGQQPTFKSATALVEVDAVVLDKDGNFVPGLKLEDITLLENGKPQKIQQFFMVTNNLGQTPGALGQRARRRGAVRRAPRLRDAVRRGASRQRLADARQDGRRDVHPRHDSRRRRRRRVPQRRHVQGPADRRQGRAARRRPRRAARVREPAGDPHAVRRMAAHRQRGRRVAHRRRRARSHRRARRQGLPGRSGGVRRAKAASATSRT